MGLTLGGILLLGAVIVIVISSTGGNSAKPQASPQNESFEANAEHEGNSPLTNDFAVQSESVPFHDEGIHQVGPLVRDEIVLSNARFVGFATTPNGLPYATWRMDYEFTAGGFPPAMLRDAYELRIRGSRLENGNIPQERAWTIRHSGNQAVYREEEAGARMLNPKGTIEVTWVIPTEDFAPPYTFWVYRKEPQSDDFFLRVSNYAAADGEIRP